QSAFAKQKSRLEHGNCKFHVLGIESSAFLDCARRSIGSNLQVPEGEIDTAERSLVARFLFCIFGEKEEVNLRLWTESVVTVSAEGHDGDAIWRNGAFLDQSLVAETDDLIYEVRPSMNRSSSVARSVKGLSQ